MSKSQGIKAIDNASIHRITSGQVVIDLQTAVKELLENSIDAGATNVEARFKNYGLTSIEVIDNGSGISEEDYDSIALKHHTSKLETFNDLTTVRTFGFRGEALSSLCALSEEVTVFTATSATEPMGVTLVMDSSGRVKGKSTAARTRGTSITLSKLFTPLPVRRKEFERNAKREFGKALSLLNAYALVPCATLPGVRLTVSNQPEKGAKSVQIRTLGSPSCRASVTALWGPKALENIVDMDLEFEVEKERTTLKRLQSQDTEPVSVRVKGLISKFAMGCGRTGTDRQFFYVNGRPCNMNKVQKAFNEVYRSFNTNQAPFILADFIIPTESYDVNVSPDKRTILLHSEGNLISALKVALEDHFSPSRATYDLEGGAQGKSKGQTQPLLPQTKPPPATRATRQRNATGTDTGDEPSLTRRQPPAKSPITQTTSDHDLPDKSQLVAAPSSRQSLAKNDQASSSKILPETSQLSATPSPPHQPAPGNDNDTMSPLPEDDFREAGPDDSMDVDHDDSESAQVVLDTSQTSWGRKLGMAPRTRPPTSNPEPDIATLAPEEVERSGHVRKKRKSDIGTIVTAEGDSIYVEDDELLSDEEAPRKDASPIPSPKRKRDKPSVKQMLPKTATQNPRLNMRSQLAGFARTGSQVSHSQEEPSMVDKEGCETDEELEDEKDELEEEEEEEENNIQQVHVVQTQNVEKNLPKTPVKAARSAVVPSAGASVDIGQSSAIENSTNLIDLALEDDDDTEDPTSILSQARASSSTTPSTISHKDRIHRPEIIKTDKDGREISLKVDLDRIKDVWSKKHHGPQSGMSRVNEREGIPQSVPVDASISNTENDAKAADALARVIEKKDFVDMDVVGQFNLGFIVVRRQKGRSTTDDDSVAVDKDILDDLFIVDQHAADEKYNFETLQATTKIQSQKLFRPRPLELTASDEMLAIENMDILQQNGFEIDVEEESSAGPGSRLKLTAQPVSKSTVFDIKDLEEVIHLMRDRPGRQMVRCSKARAMFASRACRKSVMIGMPLNQHQMTTVIRHMGTMDQPWNCPHGRPTMRHLLDIRTSGSKSKGHIDWSSIC